jgi:outer membrane protein assembly factor BamB
MLARMDTDRSLLVVGAHGHVYAFDRQSGEVRWHNSLSGGGTEAVALAIGFGVVIASGSHGKIFCLDYQTGNERWSAAPEGTGRASLLLEADQVVCAKGGTIHAFGHATGSLLWKATVAGSEAVCAIGYPGNVQQADE